MGTHTVPVHQAILGKNDQQAQRNRLAFRDRGILVLNILSAPGSGKTAFLERTLTELGKGLRAGVIAGDLATENDAQRLRRSGAPVVQITTGNVCHLEAEMVNRAMSQLDWDSLELLFIENVGNLVCPASYDLGEELRVVLLSVTEGEDKPLKYPKAFKTAHVVVVNKIDIAAAVDFDRTATLANIRGIAPQTKIFEVSARTGEGMEHWYDYLQAHRMRGRSSECAPHLAT
jgi:hydrogenase nickel incorporation protein HypB